MPQDHAGKGVQVGLLLLPVAFLAGPLAAVYGDADILAFVRGHPVPLAVAVLASLGIGVVLASLKREELHGYWAMLIATAVLLPSAMVLITTVVYLAGVPALTALLWGALTAAEVWLVAALMFRTFAEAQHGIPSSYGELRQRLDQLKATLDVTCATSTASDPHATLACSEATTQTKKIEDDLKDRGLPWVLARGYVNVWERLHRAEEALIVVAPKESVLAGALYDDLRLQNSTIDNGQELLGKLRKAVEAMDPAAKKYLKAPGDAVAPPLITTPFPLVDGSVGVPHFQQFTAAGAGAPYRWTVTGAVPDGLTLSPEGLLSGIPKVDKTFAFTVQVTDGAGGTAKENFSLLIKPALAIVSTSPLPDGVVGAMYFEALLASGDMSTHTWTVSGTGLPADLTLSPKGVLSGTPTTPQATSFTVEVKDVNSATASRSFALRITPSATALDIVTPSPLPKATLGTPYSGALQATGGRSSYTWAVTGGAVPDGLTLSSAGVLSGIPTAAKTSAFTVQVTDKVSTATMPLTLLVEASPVDALARQVLRTVRQSINEYRDVRWNALIVARNRLVATMFLTGLIVVGLLTIAMVANVSRTTVLAASVFYLVGATIGLCNRLRSESQAEGAIEDYGLSVARLITIPLFSGLGAVGGVVLMAMLPFASASFGPTPAPPSSPAPPTISTTSPLPASTVALAYFETLQAAGGTPPYKWSVGKGPGSSLPDGLALSATGVLSGTPTNEGTGDFVLQIVDTAGVTAEKKVTLPIKPLPKPPPPLPELAISSTAPLPGGTVGTAYLERLQATGGKPPYKWAIASGKLPEKVELAETGILSGTPQKAEPSSFVVQLTDQDKKTAKKDLTISIAQPTAATATPAVGTGAKPSRVPPLEEVFDLGKNLLGLLVAAIFGLAPGLLFDRLQQQADTYRADLKSSQAGQGAAPRT